jgi:hypothetical protein
MAEQPTAVILAREVVAYADFQKAEYRLADSTIDIIARAVLEQHAEIERLTALHCAATVQANSNQRHWDDAAAERDQLSSALAEALDCWEGWVDGADASEPRIAELRKLVQSRPAEPAP